MKTKKCTYCKKEKELNLFYKRKEGLLGRVSRCSECMKFLDLKKDYQKPLDLPNEIWKDVPNYEGLYQASNLGRIKSLERELPQKNNINRVIREKLITTTICKGYSVCSVTNVLKKKTRTSFHRLVAFAFIPNPYNLPCVNHINGIKSDNRVENLEWCTYSENEIHSKDFLKKIYAFGEKSGSAKLTEQKVLAIRRLYSINPKYNRKKIAEKLGIHPFSLNDIHRRKSWKHI